MVLLYGYSGQISRNLGKNISNLLHVVSFYRLEILEKICKRTFKYFFSNDIYFLKIG